MIFDRSDLEVLGEMTSVLEFQMQNFDNKRIELRIIDDNDEIVATIHRGTDFEVSVEFN